MHGVPAREQEHPNLHPSKLEELLVFISAFSHLVFQHIGEGESETLSAKLNSVETDIQGLNPRRRTYGQRSSEGHY